MAFGLSLFLVSEIASASSITAESSSQGTVETSTEETNEVERAGQIGRQQVDQDSRRRDSGAREGLEASSAPRSSSLSATHAIVPRGVGT